MNGTEMDMATNWHDLVRHPAHGDHIVQMYQDDEFLAEAVAEYVVTGLRAGEAAVIIATPEHRAKFVRALEAQGFHEGPALKILDAEETLARFMSKGTPQWREFHEVVGGLIAELRLQYPTVRAYGEMVNVLWQRGAQEAALRLEEFWNELARLQTFSLLCAYYMDPLDGKAYGGPMEGVCKAHTHVIPARDYARFNEAVAEASRNVLDQPLARMLQSLSASQRPPTHMPLGQATLLWLMRNMPRTADKVLNEARARLSPDQAC
jgi:hypothetical protein